MTSLRNGMWVNMTITPLHPRYMTRFGKGIWANGSAGLEPGTKGYVSLAILRNNKCPEGTCLVMFPDNSFFESR